jgi:predicted kinase
MSNKIESISAEKTKPKRDSRSHEQRVADLNAAFIRLKAQAIANGHKTTASAAKVLEAAKVNRTYFYAKDKLKDKAALTKYHEVRDAIQGFQENFDKFSDGTVVNQLKEKLQQIETQRNQIANTLTEQQKLVAGLQDDNAALKKKVRLQSDHMIDVVHSARIKSTPEGRSFGEVRIVSPDIYLWRNGQDLFDDENIRQQAWEQTKEDLKQALQRPLPMRVYILVGSPCAGKSTWAEKYSNFYPDLHAVAIDATNLTQFSRLEWVSIINKYRSTKEIRVCAVVFLTPRSVLQSRNNRREPTKRLDDEVLLQKADSLEFPNLMKEDIDEMIVERG